jgi:hypothetical protein
MESANFPLKICLKFPIKLPSWNAILNAHHYQRAKWRVETRTAFMCALSASENASSIQTTYQANHSQIVCGMQAFYAMTLRRKLAIKSSRGNPVKTRRLVRRKKKVL